MPELFHKWRHIENLDDFLASEEVKRWGPDCRCIITEKLDGSNLQMAWDCVNGGFTFFTRNGNNPFETVKGFAAFADSLGDLAELCSKLSAAHPECSAVGFYGELIGSKAMNRLGYCEELQVRLFHAYRDNADGTIVHTTFPELQTLLTEAGLIEKYGMPVLGEVKLSELVGWQAPAYKSAFPNAIGFEGVVFHPVEPGSWTRILFKWKTEEFREVGKRVSVVKTEQQLQAERFIAEARAIFREYVNVNRAYGIVSKFGGIGRKDIGRATAALIADAREDFLKDHPEYVGNEFLKEIFNVGADGYLIIRRLAYEAEAQPKDN